MSEKQQFKSVLETPGHRHPFWLVAAIFLVALNLRPALTSLGPVLPDIRLDLGLSGLNAGILTTVPVLCLGLLAPPAARMGKLWGTERMLMVALFILGAGLIVRSLGGQPGLYAGTLLAGSAIGIAGSLLPAVVKRDFPRHADLMTGFYTMALCLGGSLGAGLTVPVQQATSDSWRLGLAVWALPALISGILWLPMARADNGGRRATPHHRGLWRHPLAWQVTLYMGLQSSMAYMVFEWLPTILQSRGLSSAESGFMLSASVMVQTTTALTGPWLATRGKNQRPAVALMILLTILGLAGLLYAPLVQRWFWVVVLGLGMGGMFSIALALIVLRAASPAMAADLSGMAQGVGYVLAAFGPLALGLIPETFGSWRWAGLLFAIILGFAFVFAMGAARDLHIELPPTL